MEYFLENIAKSLYNEFGNTLNRHCLVFPNRRAGLYFLKYLAARIDKPVWIPSILTINDLFRRKSRLQIAGTELLLFELYTVYKSIKKSAESFDDFYFWGEMLINDFDDIDKYLVDASLLFRNVLDIKTIDQQFGGLTESQKEIVRQFWINFDPVKPTNEKSGFVAIWSILFELYSGFKGRLKDKNLAFEGMIFREVGEASESYIGETNEWDIVHFIGFNALNECEKTLMKRLKKEGKARFYWDYDISYINEGTHNSAGFFMKENLKLFGNDMAEDWKYETMLSDTGDKVKRRIIETSSDVAQVKLISQLLSDIPSLTSENAHHTAVVLADENLLMPVLSSLPENAEDINITMGYPLKQTLVYSLVRNILSLQTAKVGTDGKQWFNFKDVMSVILHPFIDAIVNESDKSICTGVARGNQNIVSSEVFKNSEKLGRIFRVVETPRELSNYLKEILSMIASDSDDQKDEMTSDSAARSVRNEYIYRIVLSINRLESIVISPEILFSKETYIRIFDRMLRIQSVPFSGEPLSGIQIMGILETRALDFKNLIVLSVNEGVLPATTNGSSFIPFSIREAFGLPSINHQESIFAYHFYRLLQRAENVTFTYNSNSEGLRNGEMSRFLTQMKYDKLLRPELFDLNYEVRSYSTISDRIERNQTHINELSSQFLDKNVGRVLSPSAINMWLNCRMKFYYRYVNNLKEPEKISSEIDPSVFGNIIHTVMKNLYNAFTGKVITSEILAGFYSDEFSLRQLIEKAMNEKSGESGTSLYGGNELIIKEVLLVYIKRIIQADLAAVPITILNLEQAFNFSFNTLFKGVSADITIGGIIDRVDQVSGITRIVDYKTGQVSETLRSVSELFEDDRKKDHDGWLQTMLYCEAYLSSTNVKTLRPSVYKVKKISSGRESDKLRIRTENRSEVEIDDYMGVREEFLNGLKNVINQIFSEDEPFIMTSDTRGKCSFCAYRELCLR